MKNKFLWGGSTASFQYEGAFNSDGKGLSTHDFETDGSFGQPRYITYLLNGKKQKARSSFSNPEDIPNDAIPSIFDEEYYPSHKAVDFYNHYIEDIKLMAELGFSVFRFSISWPRIFPNGDEEKPNQKGLDFYKKVFLELKKYNIEPMVTIAHDELPVNLAIKYDGWSCRKTIDYYLKYCETLFENFGCYCNYWLTFNEINLARGFASTGTHKVDDNTHYNAIHNMFVASSKAIVLGHSLMPNSKFSAMFALSPIYAATCNPEDVFYQLQCRRDAYFCMDVMSRGHYPAYSESIFKRKSVTLNYNNEDLEIIKNGTLDFISFSYYRSTITNKDRKYNFIGGDTNPYLKTSDWGWPIDPIGLRYVLNEIYDRYEKPLFIVENGFGTEDKIDDEHKIDDEYRIDYLKAHFKSINEAIDIDGVNCFGYTMWAPIDLVSLSTGEMKKRYGVVYVDMDDKGNGTLSRYKKKSFYWYKKIIESNGENLD